MAKTKKKAAPKKQAKKKPKKVLATKSDGKAAGKRAASRTSVIPQEAAPETAASGPGTANESAPAPAAEPPPDDKPDREAIHAEEQHEADKASDAQDLKEKVERAKQPLEVEPVPASKEEVARLAALGLVERPVKGTPLMLVGLANESKAPPTDAQRIEMAKRLNEVGPRLPRYVMHLVDHKRPASSTRAILEVATHVKQGEEMAKQKAAEKAKDEAADKAGPKRRTKKVEAAAKPEKPKGAKKDGAKKAGGIGNFIRDLLAKGKETDAILAAVKEKFPTARTSASSIAWYRSEMRGTGALPKK